ncbi:helix-turn-helix domain-containing protein [Thomasclavelia cocleata]|uniref:helix-turn-helix domain-containing protein n=1 Tax=Thomasclavelia cocleata TaxID=69824 RepID=UPI002494B16D|nr:helix-turn-helix transcriptional regulator [Thomasclavelia cocleata]
MKIKQAVKKILKQENLTQVELSERMGYARSTSLSTVLSSNNPKANNLIKMMDALGYEIVLRPKTGKDKVARSVILNNEESIANEFLINSNDKKYIEFQKKLIDIQMIYDVLNNGSDLQIKSLDVNDENFMIAFKEFRKKINQHEAILECKNEEN